MSMVPRRLILLANAAIMAAPVAAAVGAGASRRAAAQTRQIGPNTPVTLADAIAADQRLGRFAQLLGRTGADVRLREPGQWTVFAPTDSAFNWMPGPLAATLEGRGGGEAPPDMSRVGSVALQHIVPFSYPADRLAGQDGELEAVNGGRIRIAGTRSPIELRAVSTPGVLSAPGANVPGAAKILVPDIMVSNGVLHIIDTVLLP